MTPSARFLAALGATLLWSCARDDDASSDARVATPPAPRPVAAPSPPAPPPAAPAPSNDDEACPPCPCVCDGGDAVDPATLSPSVRDKLTLTPAAFTDMPGWADDRHGEALPAVWASCDKIDALSDDARLGVDGNGGRARHWRAFCKGARALKTDDHAGARAFFERMLTPYAASGREGQDGKMTGYYVQALRGSRKRHGRYKVPIYARPPDLIAIDLVPFLPDARGRRIWGRLDDKKGTIVPYATRAEIRRGALRGKGLELLWVDDPVDALFAQIQGSGKVTLDDGTEQWIEFAGKNGRSYRGVGKILRDLGEPPGTGTMQGIRKYFAEHPEKLDEISDQNESFVFFALSRRAGAIGSSGVVLTPRRSMAVDRAFVAAGTPIWVDTRAPDAKGKVLPWRSLLVAQDTGEGIRGAVRGDIYWGHDAEATEIAGHMGGKGRYWLLLPRGVPIPKAHRPPPPAMQPKGAR